MSSMKITRDQVKSLAQAVNLEIPEEDLDNVTIRVGALFAAMDAIEAELGSDMDRVEPVPPVFPREER